VFMFVCIQVLRPLCSMQSIHLWKAVYLSENSLHANNCRYPSEHVSSPLNISSSATSLVKHLRRGHIRNEITPPRTHSCEDLSRLNAASDLPIPSLVCCLTRRISIPNLVGVSTSCQEDTWTMSGREAHAHSQDGGSGSLVPTSEDLSLININHRLDGRKKHEVSLP